MLTLTCGEACDEEGMERKEDDRGLGFVNGDKSTVM